MAFRLRTNVAAEADMEEAAAFIAQDSPERARWWFAGLREGLRRLPDSPHAYAVCPESEDIGTELRQFHYHAHRVIFRIHEDARLVEVLRVYHGSRRALDSRSLPD